MPFITRENASAIGRLGGFAKASKPGPVAKKPSSPVFIPVPRDNTYLERRLLRVREQIENVSDMLDIEADAKGDPQRLDRLAAALERLVDMERILDGRPLPGNMKPQERPREKGGVLGWLGQQQARPEEESQRPAAPVPLPVIVPDSAPMPQAETTQTPPDAKPSA